MFLIRPLLGAAPVASLRDRAGYEVSACHAGVTVTCFVKPALATVIAALPAPTAELELHILSAQDAPKGVRRSTS